MEELPAKNVSTRPGRHRYSPGETDLLCYGTGSTM